MVSLCPHLIEVYFDKTHEVLSTYEAQILEQVSYGHIAEGLIFRKVLSQAQSEKILLLSNETHQMAETMEIVKKRVWGLENFIIVLMEEKCNPWLVEKLHESYTQYLLVEIKKQKALECDCPTESTLMSTLNKQWMTFLKTVDKILYDTGTSIGFVNQTIFPTGNLLSFINDRLPLPKRLRAPQRLEIESSDPSVKTVLNDKILSLDSAKHTKALEFSESKQNETYSTANTATVANSVKECVANSEYSESEETEFSSTSTSVTQENEESWELQSDDEFDVEKQDFHFSRSKSASAEALYRKDITSLLNFHDLGDEMLEWDEENETPEFTNQSLLITSPLAMPTFDAGTQTTTSTETK